MKTIREQIIGRIIVQLETITTKNGYHNNIGSGHVYRQESIIEKNRTPALSVWELSEIRERNSYGGTVRKLTIKVEGILEVNETKHPATVSNELLGDIEKALIIGDTTLDELIDDIQDIAAEVHQLPIGEGHSGVADADLERKLAGAAIDFEISYTTEWGDPYTQ
ncbi:hypothetical protein [Candidatus Parabeggiatoa sp. HSG14]|uniref:hypothetical protein n=1 Tax=Candidatus Parabeggiatoa sp. HSG14 TaxID=3055593 RepID=UPI0025A6C284|nr:hypothetical protein [Thiotrichales bacterium HSG14]